MALTPYMRIFEKLSTLFDREPVQFDTSRRRDADDVITPDPTDTSLPFDTSEDHVVYKELTNPKYIGPFVAGEQPDIIIGYVPPDPDDSESAVSCRDYGFEIHVTHRRSEYRAYPPLAVGRALAELLGIPFRSSADFASMIQEQRMIRGGVAASEARMQLFEAECVILQHERHAGVLIIPDAVVQYVLYNDDRLHKISREAFNKVVDRWAEHMRDERNSGPYVG